MPIRLRSNYLLENKESKMPKVNWTLDMFDKSLHHFITIKLINGYASYLFKNKIKLIFEKKSIFSISINNLK